MYFRYFVIISPWKRGALFKNLNPLYPKIVPSLVEIGPVVLEEKKKMWKVYNNDGGQQKNCDKKSPLEPLARVSLKADKEDISTEFFSLLLF